MDKQEQDILNTIERFHKKLPKFPDGRIDYSNSNIAPVIKIIVKYKDKILILKRSDKVRTYKGKWNTVAGYLDELKSIRKKVLEELYEETGISEENILHIKIGNSYNFFDNDIKKTWLVHPVFVELKHKPEIKLDWEHTQCKWIKPEELNNYDIVRTTEECLEKEPR